MPRPLPECFRTPEALERAVNDYLDSCAGSIQDRELKTGGVQPWMTRVPSMAGLAVALGVDKVTLYKYIDSDKDLPEDRQYIVNSLSRARGRIEAATLEAAAAGRVDSRTAALILAGYGYGQRVDVSGDCRVTVAGAGAADLDAWSE